MTPNIMDKRKDISPSQSAGLLLTLVLSLLFVAMTFSRDFIIGTSAYWQAETEDITQYIAGFNAFFSAPWQWPLLAFKEINHPTGTLVTFVDAIPIYALVLKGFLPQSLTPFNPFGWWVAGCFVMQGVAAWCFVRTAEVKSWTFLITLTGVLLCFPALMARMGHISLMSHWILLLALVLYVHGHRKSVLPIARWSFLLVVSFYINIYLFVMAVGLYVAAWLSTYEKLRIQNIIRASAPFTVLFVTLWVTVLPLTPSKVTPEWGFGYYSMNLLAPFLGGSLIKIPYQTAPGQYEGFNYLGVGVLFAGLIVVAHYRARILSMVAQHKAIALVMVSYTVYALSSQIYLAEEQIMGLPYPGFMQLVTSQFRASGRFFWPVGYALILFSWYLLYKTLDKVRLVIALCICSTLQILDLKDQYQQLLVTQARKTHPVLHPLEWDRRLKKGTQHLLFYPKFKCGKDPHGTLLPLMKYASERQLTLNTGYIARYTPDCDDASEEIRTSLSSQTAYVFARVAYADLLTILELFPASRKPECLVMDIAYLCQYGSQQEKP